MKARFWWLTGVLAMGCASKPRTPPSGTETSKKPAVTVYFEGEGSDHDIRRFQKFLEIALKDSNLVSTGSSRDADAIIKMRFSHEQRTEDLYAPIVWITLESSNHQKYIAKSCNAISNGVSIFNAPIESLNTVRLPADWKKRGPAFVIYINDAEMQYAGQLLSVVKRQLVLDGYRITATRSDADAALQSIKVQKMAIPMRVDAYHADEEVLDRYSNRIMYSSGRDSFKKATGTGYITYLGPEQGIKAENLPCMINNFQSSIDGDSQSAGAIAETIRRYFDGKANSD